MNKRSYSAKDFTIMTCDKSIASGISLYCVKEGTGGESVVMNLW